MKGVKQTIQWTVCSPERAALLSPARRRACIDRVRAELIVSERRACRVLRQHRSMQRKVPAGRADEDLLEADMIELTLQYGQYGYPLPGRVMRSMIPRGMDWHSRKVLSWRLSNSMDADFCVEALKEAIAKHGTPEIFNSDQGSQFTSGAWIDVLTDAKIKISMDGKGAWRDNRMIERLWRSLKYECVYLNAFETGTDARAGIGKWMTYYNSERPHSTHGLLTPNEAYASKTEPMRIAA